MWNFESATVKKFFGANLKKAKTNHDKELKKIRDKFVETYPYAKLSEFEFWINLSKNGEISSKTNIVYKGPGETEGTRLYDLTGRTWKYSWDVASDVFKYKYSGALHWGPSKIWDPQDSASSSKSFEIAKGELPFRPNHFRIFVNGDQSFLFATEPLSIKWTNSLNVKDITKVKVDKEDPYFASLIAAYIISQKSGICSKHLRGDASVPKIVTSVLRFYVYYHMSRFLRTPEKMDKYVTKEMTNLIQKNLPVKKVWTKKYHQGKETISAWLRTQPNKENIRNARHYGGGNGSVGGVIGIEYEEVDEVLPMDESKDWKKFFQDGSNGITQTGQLFLQKAAEAYVYCVLGAQAQTRWRIVRDGAKSLQTQEVFAKLVKDTVAQDDDKVLITNMRTAVKATNVVLNLAILPKLILIPSDLLFLKEKIHGYNNTLTSATKTMRFEENEGLNFDAEETEGTEGTAGSEGTTSETTSTTSIRDNDNTT